MTWDHTGVQYVSAPVFGRPDAALEHRVLFAVAGPKEAKQKLQKYFDWMGRGILVLPPQAHAMAVFTCSASKQTLCHGQAHVILIAALACVSYSLPEQ